MSITKMFEQIQKDGDFDPEEISPWCLVTIDEKEMIKSDKDDTEKLRPAIKKEMGAHAEVSR